MYTLEIPDMTCGHCESVVTEMVCALDPRAKVAIDLTSRTAHIETGVSLELVLTTLDAGGYPAQPR